MTSTVTRPTRRPPRSGAERTVRKRPAPAVPRRVSGPVRAPAPKTAPRPASVRRPLPRERGTLSLRERARVFLRGLPDHPLLDRAIRGRAWIPLLGVMLAGIVAMQVEVLKLGANIGRSIERSTALQSRNELLRASVASLADDQRVERLAAGMGMVMPGPATVGFLNARGTNARRAIAGIQAPDPTSFLSSLSVLTASSAALTTPATALTTSTASTSTAPTTASTAPTTTTPTPTTSSSAATSTRPTVQTTQGPTQSAQPTASPQGTSGGVAVTSGG